MIKSGLAFHCHHDTLCEYVYDFNERVRFIKGNKPKSEQKLRLRLFKMIPDELIPGKGSPEWEACGKAREAYDKAREAYGKAWEAYYKAGEAYYKAREAYYKAGKAYDKAREANGKAREAYDKAWEACCKAREANGKAREAYDKAWEACGKAWEVCGMKYSKELEKLHTNLCPDCPWNGKTIFCT